MDAAGNGGATRRPPGSGTGTGARPRRQRSPADAYWYRTRPPARTPRGRDSWPSWGRPGPTRPFPPGCGTAPHARLRAGTLRRTPSPRMQPSPRCPRPGTVGASARRHRPWPDRLRVAQKVVRGRRPESHRAPDGTPDALDATRHRAGVLTVPLRSHHLIGGTTATRKAPASGRSSHRRGVPSEDLEKQAGVCVSAGLDHGHALASYPRAARPAQARPRVRRHCVAANRIRVASAASSSLTVRTRAAPAQMTER